MAKALAGCGGPLAEWRHHRGVTHSLWFGPLVGPAVALHTGETLHATWPDRFPISDNLGRLVAAGKPGLLTWGAGGPEVDPEVRDLFVVGDRPSTEEQVRERALAALAEEPVEVLLKERRRRLRAVGPTVPADGAGTVEADADADR